METSDKGVACCIKNKYFVMRLIHGKMIEVFFEKYEMLSI